MPGMNLPCSGPSSLPRGLRDELASLYDQLEARLRGLGVGCWVRGRCCDFKRRDHRLFASSVEIAYAREALRGDLGQDPELCPFWILRRCTARTHRPLGCRTYFCDPRYRDVLEALYEEFYREIQAMARRHGYSWYYGPFVESVRGGLAARNG